MLSKVLFPFTNRYPDLRRHWWHRLMVVLFFTSVTGMLLGLYVGQNMSEMASYSSCYQLGLRENVPSAKLHDDCQPFLPHNGFNFLAAVVCTVITFYLLQVLYYRVVLYVTLGHPEQVAGPSEGL